MAISEPEKEALIFKRDTTDNPYEAEFIDKKLEDDTREQILDENAAGGTEELEVKSNKAQPLSQVFEEYKKKYGDNFGTYLRMAPIVLDRFRNASITDLIPELEKIFEKSAGFRQFLATNPTLAPVYAALLFWTQRKKIVILVVAITALVTFLFMFIFSSVGGLTTEDKIGLAVRCGGTGLDENLCVADGLRTACQRTKSNAAQQGEDISQWDCDLETPGIQ